MSANPTQFDWKASESAPEHYPMKIIRGDLIYRGGGGSLYVPSGGVISHGWGRMRSSHITGPDLKPLPDKLDITFFSYLEDQFYEGRFDLPYDKILRLFQEVEARPKEKDLEGRVIPNDFRIIVGVAPGGTVAVWVRANGTKEVFFGQAKKVDLDFTKAMDFPAAKRAIYVKKIIESEVTPDFLAALRKNGIPFKKWANYRTRYNWVPSFAVSHPPKKFGASFFNGESGNFPFPLEKSFTTTPQPVPDEMDFSYAVNGQGTNYLYIIQFDEAEMLTAFAKLGASQKPFKLEFHPKVPIQQTEIRLHNDKESIPLKKFTIKHIN